MYDKGNASYSGNVGNTPSPLKEGGRYYQHYLCDIKLAVIDTYYRQRGN
jgi:hypothetical protein